MDPRAGGHFALERCRGCAGAVTVGAPTPPPAAPEEVEPAPRGARLAAPLLAGFDRRRLRMLRAAVPPPARLLDVGAGRGRFVAAARRAGYDAEGIEPDPARAAAGAAYGVHLRVAGLEGAGVRPGALDAVTVWHVLEHLPDPDGAVSTVAQWLRPGGAALVGVPNLGSLQARLGAARWYHLDLPRHRTHFTPAGLHALLRRHGLRPLRTHHVLAEHNPFGMWQSLVNRATRTPSYAFNRLKRAAAPDRRDLAVTVAALPLIPPAAALELAAGLARRGGSIAVLARRDEG
jgi:SAM-dependent methyltransferase